MSAKQFAVALIFLLATADACGLPTARFHSISIAEGIPNNIIRAIAQDKSGFIWFGTDNGLARFDGYQIRNFFAKPGDKGSLSSNRIRSLHTDPNGNIWVGTYSGGLNRFVPIKEQFISYRNEQKNSNSLISDRVNALASSSAEDLWVGTDKGLDRLNLSTGQFTHYKHHDAKSLPSDQVFSLLQTEAGTLMVGTAKGVVTYDPEQNNFKAIRFSHEFYGEVWSMHQSDDGIIWIGTSSGLYQYSEKLKIAKAYTENDGFNFFNNIKINAITSDAEGNIWAGGRQTGLCRINEFKPTACYKYDKGAAQSLREDDMISVLLDHSNTLWIGTYTGGVNRLDLSSLRFGLRDDSAESAISCLTHSKVNSILVENETLHWIGTDYGLIRFDQSDGSCIHFEHDPQDSKSLAKQEVYSVFRDSRKLLWIATIAGLNRLDESTGHIDRMDGRISAEFTTFLAENKKGQLYVGTEKGLSLYQPTSDSFENIEAADSRLDVEAWIFQFDNQGRLWIGTAGGLAILEKGAKNIDFVRHKGQPVITTEVASMHIDRENTIWVGADGIGLIRFDMSGKELTRYNKSDGLPDTYFSYITSDDNGNLWIATRHGLVELDPTSRRLHNYVEADGLQSNFFMNNAGFKSANGRIFLGGNKGFNTFYPSDIELNKVPPKVVLTQLLLFNQPVVSGVDYDGFSLSKPLDQSQEVEFSHRDYVFAIEFSGLHFADPARNSYAYKMEGFDSDWVLTSAKNRRASYTNLDPGSYVFRVKSSNKDGTWNNKAKSIRIKILPAPWATWWAYVLYALIVILTLIAVFITRTKALRRRTELLEQTVQERTYELSVEKKNVENLLANKEQEFVHISHELRTPLTLVSGPIKAALKLVKNVEIKKKLEMAERNGNRLLNIADQLLQLERFRFQRVLEKIPQNASNVTEFIVESFQIAAAKKSIKLTLDMNESAVVKAIPDALEKILVNLISNAIKYSPSDTTIVVSAQVIDGEWILKVKDSGQGIAEDKLSHVFDKFYRITDEMSEKATGAGIGLTLVKELVTSHQGEVNITSELGNGSEFVVKLPTCAKTEESSTATVNSDFISSEIENLEWLDVQHSVEVDTVEEMSDGKPLVLIIEDNQDMQQYVQHVLAEHYNCFIASNGQQGVEKAAELIPDLIICDVMMPVMDGFEATKLIKKDERTSHIPVIILTARGDKDSRLQGWKSLTDEYLSKPFDEQELLLRVENLLSIRRILKQRFAGIVSETGLSQISQSTEVNDIDSKFLERLDSVVEENFTDPSLTLDELANKVFLSKRQFQRKLKALVDYTPVEYLRLYRLNKARDMILAGTPLREAWLDVGFSSQAYFSKCFKAQFGMSATDFIEKCKVTNN